MKLCSRARQCLAPKRACVVCPVLLIKRRRRWYLHYECNLKLLIAVYRNTQTDSETQSENRQRQLALCPTINN